MATLNAANALRRALLPKRFATSLNFHMNRNLSDASATVSKAVDEPNEISNNNKSNTDLKLDPFGIEDIDHRSSTVLVQGFFEDNWTKPTKKKSTSEVDEASKSKEIEQSSKLQIYEGWLKNRQQTNRKEKFAGPAESYRETSFGNVRLDSDNTMEEEIENNKIDSGSRFDQNYVKPPPRRIQIDEIQDESEKKLTAFEFLKNFKEEKTEEIKQARIIGKKMNPRLIKRETDEELDKARFAERLVDPNVMDSNKIPKIYQLPLYNELTKHDMWNVLKSQIIFQNEFLLAIDKPAGVPIHSKAIDCRHYITEFLEEFAQYANCEKVYPLHRLDKETTGVLLFAKDQRVASYIIEKLSLRQVEKKYLAITKLCPQVLEGTIKIPIGEGKVGGTEKYRQVLKPDLRKYEIRSRQSDCKEAITHFKVIRSVQDAAFLEVRPETGLKHQIRIHLGLGLGCPVIGDHKYSHRDRMAPQRLTPQLLRRIKVKQSKLREVPLHLHCNSISFTLPPQFTKSVEPIYVHANVPKYFNYTLGAFGLKSK